MEATDVLKALLGFLLGATSSYLGLYWKVKKDLEAQYDKDLRADRLQAYIALWKLMQPLAKYSRPGPVTLLSLEKLSADLRQWYYEVGGIFMSKKTRDQFFALQRALISKASDARKKPDHEVPDQDVEQIRKNSSRLRTATTVDVGSRKDPMLGDEESA